MWWVCLFRVCRGSLTSGTTIGCRGVSLTPPLTTRTCISSVLNENQEDQPTRYLFQDEWLEAETHQEKSRSGTGQGETTEETISVTVTRHGPVIAGDPAEGTALAFKYTATEKGSSWPAILWQMLRARNAEELMESQRNWVDPVNNFLFGRRSRRLRLPVPGRIPIRSRSRLAAGTGLDRRARMGRRHTLRGTSPVDQPAGRLYRHR